MKIRVSVVIPAYNATKTIGDGLESFARQSFPAAEVEIIIVDDGSTDGTPEYLETYARSWGLAQPRLRVMRQAHQGPAAARNLGRRRHKGIFCCLRMPIACRMWIGSRKWWRPSHCRRLPR